VKTHKPDCVHSLTASGTGRRLSDSKSSEHARPDEKIAATTLPCFVNRIQLFGRHNNVVRKFTFAGLAPHEDETWPQTSATQSEKVSNLSSMTDTTKVATISSASAQVQVKANHANTETKGKRRRNNLHKSYNFIGPVIDLTNED
jgi:hypothetical protein